jgi:hypothetical protein
MPKVSVELELVSAAVTPIGSTFGEAAFLALAENGKLFANISTRTVERRPCLRPQFHTADVGAMITALRTEP